MTGEIIGAERGWDDDGDGHLRSRYMAFDGDRDTFYDPAEGQNKEHFVGIKMPEAYVLTEIRILPRGGYLHRHNGAALYGFNGGGFDPRTATLIWVSDYEMDGHEFDIIPASRFIAGANTGFESFAYYNDNEWGNVAGLELYGNPASGSAPVAPQTDSGLAAAPRTADMRVMTALAALVATALVTLKLTRKKLKYKM
jgi:hypothetical protein